MAMPVTAGDPLIVQVLGWPFVLALVLLLCAALLAFVIVLGNTESRNTVVERLRALDHQTFTRGGMMEVGRCASIMCRKTHARGHAHIYMNNYTDEYKGTCASIGVMDQAVGQASEVHAHVKLASSNDLEEPPPSFNTHKCTLTCCSMSSSSSAQAASPVLSRHPALTVPSGSIP